MQTTELQHEQQTTEADLEAAFVELVRASWNNPATVIAFKDAVAAVKGEA
jgi:hypothetical protein